MNDFTAAVDALFADPNFGESVVYTPLATGIPATITAVWLEIPSEGIFNEVNVDTLRVELHLRASDVPSPKEGDIAQRVTTSKTMKVVPPIRPDDKGMIAVTLESK